jgi:hypothetical protein
MKNTERGLAIIFNHECFDEIDGDSAEPRSGTASDVERLYSTFSDLGFTIDLQANKTYNEIIDHISEGTSFTRYLSYIIEI